MLNFSFSIVDDCLLLSIVLNLLIRLGKLPIFLKPFFSKIYNKIAIIRHNTVVLTFVFISILTFCTKQSLVVVSRFKLEPQLLLPSSNCSFKSAVFNGNLSKISECVTEQFLATLFWPLSLCGFSPLTLKCNQLCVGPLFWLSEVGKRGLTGS